MGAVTSTMQQLNVNEPDALRVYTIRRKIQATLQGHIDLLDTDVSDDNIQPIVIKQTSKDLVNQGISKRKRKVAENYLEEVRILKNLSSFKDVDPSICRIVNNYIWNDDNNYYYAMEYCKGGDLFDYTCKFFQTRQSLTSSNQRINTIKNHFQQLVRCVYYLHCHSIAHRDLSLENVMLDEEGENIKLIDFGVAYDKLKHNNSWITSERVGKRSYMAPETYKRMSYDARSADVFSLGVILYVMVCGRFPFDRKLINHETHMNNLIDGRIKYQLEELNIEQYFNDEIIDLLDRIFKYEKQRITMEELLTHSFVGLDEYVDLYKHGNTTNGNGEREGEIDTEDESSQVNQYNNNLSDESYQSMIVLNSKIINQNYQFLH